MASTDPAPSTLTKHDKEVKILTIHDEEVKARTKHGEEVTTPDWNETLRGIARQGDSDALYETLHRAPNIFNQIDKIHLVHTPLHEAVEAGRTHLAIEILILKPSLGRKLNPHGQSPLHLALRNGELAKRLIKYDSELIRVQGKGGKTPLHCVAEAGDTDLLAEFLCACPESIKDLTIRDETAFHIAVKQRQVSASRLIFEWIWRSYNGQLLIWKDEDGNTVLHIAVSTKQHEIVELLVRRAPIIKNEKNSAGMTALEIAAHEDWTIRNIILGREKAPPHEGTKLFNKDARSLDDFLLSSEPYFEKVLRFILYCRRELSLDMRNMVLVVAVLIATATFEARGSLIKNESTKSSASASGSNMINIGKVVGDLSYYSISTVSFTASIAVMILVLSFKPFTSFLHLSLVFMAISYGYKMVNISPWQTAFPISLIVLVYAFKLYFEDMEREIKMEMPAIWMGFHPSWKAMPPVPVPLERLRMVYRLMNAASI